MNILINPGSHSSFNMGDLAMLQVAYERLRKVWPDATVRVLTADAAALERFCPGTVPVPVNGLHQWNAEHPLLGQRAKQLPAPLRDIVRRLEHRLQESGPATALSLMQHRYGHQGGAAEDLRSFLHALTTSDLVMMCGQGSINDGLKPHARQALGLLHWSQMLNIPTVALGQGIGPIEDPELFDLARSTLSRTKLVTIRERLMGAPLLKRLGVTSDRVRVTGDTAIEMARRITPEKLGNGIGLSIRVVTYAKVDGSILDVLRPVVQSFARAHGAPLVAIPIMRGTQLPDEVSIAELCKGYEGPITDASGLTSPELTASAVHGCRVVVTGTYHGAVFALSQGVPAVCVANSKYYAAKFLGLADQFGVGCNVVMLDKPDATAQLQQAMREAWKSAEDVRPQLLASADRQIETSWSAYRELVLMHAAGYATDAAPPLKQGRSTMRRYNLARAVGASLEEFA